MLRIKKTFILNRNKKYFEHKKLFLKRKKKDSLLADRLAGAKVQIRGLNLRPVI